MQRQRNRRSAERKKKKKKKKKKKPLLLDIYFFSYVPLNFVSSSFSDKIVSAL